MKMCKYLSMRKVILRFIPTLLCFVTCFITYSSQSFADTEGSKTLWLDETNLSHTQCGWGQPRANLSVAGNPLSIGGKKYERGVGNHTNGRIVLVIPDGKASRFYAEVGIQDENEAQGPAEFKIFGGSKLLWQSGPMMVNDAPKVVDVQLEGVKILHLVCDMGNDYGGDHTSWGDARIEYLGECPQSVPVDRNGNVLLDDDGMPLNHMNELQCEWFDLRAQIRTGMSEKVRSEAFHPASTIMDSDRDPLDIVLRRIEPLIETLQTMHVENAPKLEAESQTLATLRERAEKVSVDDIETRRALFAEAVALRRKVALQNPLLSFDDLLFMKRHPCHTTETEGNHMCDQYFGYNALPGGGIFVLKNAFTDTPTVVDSLANQKVLAGNMLTEGKTLAGDRIMDSTFGYLSPELSHDNQYLYFAAADALLPRGTQTWLNENCYHIYRAKIDVKTGLLSEITQLTEGAYNDFDPCCLPSGRIAFISERRGGYGRCHGRKVPTYTLHSMEPDGSDITMLSPHETNEWQPDVDHAGMIIYTRWDYVDRGFNNAHHPWITTPDGRDPRVIHGNYAPYSNCRPLFEADIHPVPNSPLLTAIAAAHHGQHYGSLVLVNPKVRDDNHMAPVRRITPEQLFPEAEQGTYQSARYGNCRPLSEQFYITVFDAFGRGDQSEANNYGIYLLDCFGNRVLLYRDPKISCYDPQPLRTRAMQPIVPHKTLVGVPGTKPGEAIPADQLPKTATIGLINVYDTSLPFPKAKAEDGSETDKPIEIASLRIVQVLPKTTPYADGPRIGYGSQKSARSILGTVPVEKDGSAFFTLPVNIPVYFQALDKNGVAVQSMRSDTYVHEGESLVCQGCHEDRHSSMSNRPVGTPIAFSRQPSEIKPDPVGTSPLSYPLLIQPILDARCVECHAQNAEKNPRAIDLSRGPMDQHFSTSFENLRPYCFFFNNADWVDAQTIPGKFGARASRLWEILQSDHYGMTLTEEEKYCFALWMDNNCDFYGTYEQCTEQREGKIVPILMH